MKNKFPHIPNTLFYAIFNSSYSFVRFTTKKEIEDSWYKDEFKALGLVPFEETFLYANLYSYNLNSIGGKFNGRIVSIQGLEQLQILGYEEELCKFLGIKNKFMTKESASTTYIPGPDYYFDIGKFKEFLKDKFQWSIILAQFK